MATTEKLVAAGTRADCIFGQRACRGSDGAGSAATLAGVAGRSGADGNESGMRRGRLRSLHGVAEWRCRVCVPGSCWPSGGMRDHHRRGTGARARLCMEVCSNRFWPMEQRNAELALRGCWWRRRRCWKRNPAPDESEVMDAIGGVLCRCTGYRKIITAIMEAGEPVAAEVSPAAGAAVGARLVRLDGNKKVDGTEIFGADETPVGALGVRVVRCPHHRARISVWRSGSIRGGPSGDRVGAHGRGCARCGLLRSDSAICRSAGVCAPGGAVSRGSDCRRCRRNGRAGTTRSV